MQHPLHRLVGAEADLFGDGDDVLGVEQGVAGVLELNLVHVGAAHAAQAQHVFVRVGGGDVVAHAAFGEQQVFRGVGGLYGADQAGGGAAVVGGGDHFWAAFGMGQDQHVRVVLADGLDVFDGELFVDFTTAVPPHHLIIQRRIIMERPVVLCRQDDVLARLLGDVGRQVLIGQKDDGIAAERFHHLFGVARGAADVALRLHVSVGVDVGDDGHARELRLEAAHILGRDAGGQRAARGQRRDQHRLLRVEDFGRLRHEAHAAKDDDVFVGGRRLAAEVERVAGDVWHGVEQRRFHVVVPQDDGVALFFELIDFRRQLRLQPQLRIRRVMADSGPQIFVNLFRCHANLR